MKNTHIKKIKKISIIILIFIGILGAGSVFNGTKKQEINIGFKETFPLSAQSLEDETNTTTRTVTWHTQGLIKNPEFNQANAGWTIKTDGDTSDIKGNINENSASNTIVGEIHQFSVISNPLNATNWYNFTNPEFPAYPVYPSSSTFPAIGIDTDGMWARHAWAETARQTPSVHWIQNISMPVNMSDYMITAASVDAVVNASVDVNIDTPGDTVSQSVTYDSVKFYVKIADMNRSKLYELASNKTSNLGHNTNPTITTMNDTHLTTISEEEMKFYLGSVLSEDNYNFSIILGMDIWCEDNQGSDTDTWNMLRFKSFNFTFTYEKIINQGTKLSWIQTAEKIPGNNVRIKAANFSFNYKVQPSWTNKSPNSEIRIYINSQLFPIRIRLEEATTTFQSTEIFDIFQYISATQNNSIDLQIYLADTFESQINLSIILDDIGFYVTWIDFAYNEPPPVIIPDPEPDMTWAIYTLVIVVAGLSMFFIAYQTIWKYPKVIRELRSLRSKLRKGKEVKLATKSNIQLYLLEYLTIAKSHLSHLSQTKLHDRYLSGKKGINGKAITKADEKVPISPQPQIEPIEKNKQIEQINSERSSLSNASPILSTGTPSPTIFSASATSPTPPSPSLSEVQTYESTKGLDTTNIVNKPTPKAFKGIPKIKSLDNSEIQEPTEDIPKKE